MSIDGHHSYSPLQDVTFVASDRDDDDDDDGVVVEGCNEIECHDVVIAEASEDQCGLLLDDDDGEGIDNGTQRQNATTGTTAPPFRHGYGLEHGLCVAFVSSLTVTTTILSALPFFGVVHILYQLTMRWYSCLPLVTLRMLEGALCLVLLTRIDKPSSHPNDARCRRVTTAVAILFTLLVVQVSTAFYALVLPWSFQEIKQSFFVEIDGTIAWEWNEMELFFQRTAHWGRFVGLFYFIGVTGCGLAWFLVSCRCSRSCKTRTFRRGSHDEEMETFRIRNDDTVGEAEQEKNDETTEHFLAPKKHPSSWTFYKCVATLSLFLTTLFWISCLCSAWTFLVPHAPSKHSNIGPECDPIDTTECLLPFPSSYYTVEDKGTITGRRVNISREALRKMYKGRGPSHASFLNDLDGFSTLAPILFYMDGMKEAYGVDRFSILAEATKNAPHLIRPEEIQLSVTDQSLTLLIHLESRTLVHHFAEIDYLDKNRPLVIVQPAQPLRHDAAYALAVINAIGINGERLAQSEALKQLLWDHDGLLTEEEQLRGDHFLNVLVPALREAAPWFQKHGANDEIQMLFDFHTVSAESQLGMVRRVRDSALKQVSTDGWGDRNVRVVKTLEGTCGDGEYIARTVHVEIDVPWFLHEEDGHPHRATFFDEGAIEKALTNNSIAPVKVVVLVPCSVVREKDPVTLKGVVDFGHGFLYSREEVIWSKFLHRIANKKGFVLVASNWRGMSDLDIPVVLRTFLADPNLFRSARDNLIQGFGDKACIQHFIQNRLLDMDFLNFHGVSLKKAAARGESNIRYLFYGISQGGILGGAYSALMGPTALIDGSVLGSPGTPFALLMSRSTIFPAYLFLLKLNLYNSRHVRIFITMMQMAWDSVEAGGVLAPPFSVNETYPKTLIQIGLGDSTVTSHATEIMARAYNASILESNSRNVFGLFTTNTTTTTTEPNESSSSSSSSLDQITNTLLTEVTYEEEYASLSNKNVGALPNRVHWCTRNDPALIWQVSEFMEKGIFVDPCKKDQCLRSKAIC